MLEVQNLSKTYKKKQVVKNLSFQVEKGKLFALLGSNGAGKSTTIKMILGLVKKDSGNVIIKKEERIGYSPETPYFPPFLSGMEVMRYYGKLQGIREPELCGICRELLRLVGLKEDKTKVKYYSKGMLQRLALAQALLGDPGILILDEPCAGLDATGRIEMLALIQRLKQQGKAIVMNSHILNDMEKICDYGVIMKDGEALRTFEKEDFEGKKSLEEIFVETIGGNVAWE